MSNSTTPSDSDAGEEIRRPRYRLEQTEGFTTRRCTEDPGLTAADNAALAAIRRAIGPTIACIGARVSMKAL
jgi:hypothetical protein